jgi:hypothetical protein
MKKRDTERILRKSLAILVIYLVISLTFFTAKAFAVLNYEIYGNQNIQNYASNEDSVTLNIEADSDVSFSTSQGPVPLDGCTTIEDKVTCTKFFTTAELNSNIKNWSFTLKQISGTPLTKMGYLYIDRNAPIGNVTGVKTRTGINFTYNFSELNCKESGIGYFEINIEDRPPEFYQTINTSNCNVKGWVFVNVSGTDTYGEVIRYYAKVRDRAGNERSTDVRTLNGDFIPPSIAEDFRIMRGGSELTDFSPMAEVTADIIIEVEDSDKPTVYANLTGINSNPLLRVLYTHKKADSCNNVSSGNVYECKFSNIKLRPTKDNVNIAITAEDIYMNVANKTIPKSVTLHNSAGNVIYIGPLKSHCTEDLEICYLKSGMQILEMDIDTTSNYLLTPVKIGVNSATATAFCTQNDVWTCLGSYQVPSGVESINLFVAESRDRYGNLLRSDLTQSVMIDNSLPVKTRDLTVSNSNNNNECAISGDELTFNLRVRDDSATMKIYANTSGFTTLDVQTGECILTANNEWDCTLTVKDFVSEPPAPATRDIIVEDLAGNRLSNLNYKFNVCKTTTAGTPNYISNINQVLPIPNIDRKTASLQPVKVIIPVTIDLQKGGSIMYLTADMCVAKDTNNMNIVSSNYFTPANPNNGKDSSLMLTLGGAGSLIPEGELKINCTISARMYKSGVVYLREEKETLLLKVNTFNQPFTLDNSTQEIINAQKESLRKLSGKIEKRDKSLEFLKKACKYSDIIVKANGVLQTVKGVIYLIAVVANGIPVVGPVIAKIWPIVNPILSGIDSAVQRFVWPTGFDPTAVIGYLWKYSCLIYTCKFYTISGLVEISTDAAGAVKYAKANTVDTKLTEKANEDDKTPNKEITVYKDGHKLEEIKDGNSVISTKETYYNKDGSTRTISTEFTAGKKTKETVSIGTGADSSTATTTYDAKGEKIGYSETTRVDPGADFDYKSLQNDIQYNIDPTLTRVETTMTYNSEGVGEQTSSVIFVDTYGEPHTYPLPSKSYNIRASDFSLSQKVYKFNVPLGSGTSVTRTNSDGSVVSNTITDKYGESITFEGSPVRYFDMKRNGETTRIDVYKFNNIQTGQEDLAVEGRYSSDFADSLSDQSSLINERNMVVYNDIDRQDWIINPYRSKHYDGLCGPATTYNMKKERQIRCMYVSCLEESQINGMSSSICKDIYAVNNCLYLESAQYRLDPSVLSQLTKGLVTQSIMFAMGYAVQAGYKAVCQKYLDTMGSSDNTIATGWGSVGCGLLGAGLKWQEIWAFFKEPEEVWKSLQKGNIPQDPAEIYDYCKGGEVYAE